MSWAQMPPPRSRPLGLSLQETTKWPGASLAIASHTTDHVLTAETLAIDGLEEKQKLRLVPRPGRSPIGRSR